MEDWHPLAAVQSSRVRLLRIRRLRRKPTAGELQSDARSLHSYNDFHNDYRDNRHNNYRHYRDHYYRYNYRNCNNYSGIVTSRGKQFCQPAAGELHSDARSLHSCNDFHNDYRDNRHNNYRHYRDHYYRYNYRNYNNYSGIVTSRGKQFCQPAAGELHSDARSLQHSNNSHNDYWHNRDYCNSDSCKYYRPDSR